jgi:hypothetical protein
MPDDARETRELIENLLRKALTLTQRLPQSESVQEAAVPSDPVSSHYRVARYPYSRFYALYGTGSVSCNSIPVLHLCHFLNQEDLMEREAMVQNS